MQPESFQTDDSLGRSVQPASAPLSAKEGAFGEENAPYEAVFGDVSKIIDAARESAVPSVNAAMTAAYWLIGRRIVEFEQSGEERAEYGAALIERLAEDLTGRFDRGFSRQNVQNMRLFYLSYPGSQKPWYRLVSTEGAGTGGMGVRSADGLPRFSPPPKLNLLHGLIRFSSSWLGRAPWAKVLNTASPSACRRQFCHSGEP